ncbi:MAG: sodium:proton antiporter [Oceanospirillaceae bacterium]|nr:sodium:proton antiporter [Oceanospirillaceae bacterium]
MAVLALAWYGNATIVDGQFGWFSLLPVIAVLGAAVLTHRSVESLLFGVLVGFVLIDPGSLVRNLVNTSLATMSDGTTAWILMLTFLVGGLVALINFSGGTQAFGSWVSRFASSRSRVLIATWIMGLMIFIDDYLNALAVSSSMKKLGDRFRVSRQMIAYMVDSTSAPMCVLVPVSTWAIFIVGLFESNGVFPEGEGFARYVELIPYILYAWVAILMVPMVSLGWLPALGAMKKAEADACKGVRPHGDDLQPAEVAAPRLRNFLLPLLVFVVATWHFDFDTLLGAVLALMVTVPLFLWQGLGNLSRLFDEILGGFSSMILPMTVVLTSFVLQRVNDQLGLSGFVLDQVVPYMNAAWLPAIAFLVLSVLTFATGSFWGVYAIALPVLVPLAQALGADLQLTLGALISAGVFGSHACFFGDATVITAKGAGCSPYSHAITQLPYALIAASVATALFVLLA